MTKQQKKAGRGNPKIPVTRAGMAKPSPAPECSSRYDKREQGYGFNAGEAPSDEEDEIFKDPRNIQKTHNKKILKQEKSNGHKPI